MTTLPERWCLTPIRDLIDIDPKNDCDDDVDVGFVPLTRMGVHYRSRHTFETRKWADVKRGYKHFANGDVLLARITPSFENGKASVARGLPNGVGAGSTEYIVCRPIAGLLLPEYLLAYFKTQAFLEEGASVMSGAVGQQRIPIQFVLDCLVPIAPVNEQQRIVDKLDSICELVDACRERVNGIPFNLRRYRQSVLSAAICGDLTAEWRKTTSVKGDSNDLLDGMRASHRRFTDSLKASLGSKGKVSRRRAYPFPDPADPPNVGLLPDTWAWCSGAELVEAGQEIVYGIVQPGPAIDGGIQYIRSIDIQGGEIRADGLPRTHPQIAARHSRSAVEGGDVLLGIIRSTKVAIVRDDLTGSNIARGIARFRPSEAMRSKYLAIALEAPATQAWLHERFRGIDMPGLNLSDVRRVPIPLPPVVEQDEIVRRVEGQFSFADLAFDGYKCAKRRLERLSRSVFAASFRGELVVSDSLDEPALELMARVSTARSEARSGWKSETTRRHTMPRITAESLKQTVSEFPREWFTFDELRTHVPGDYESLRDALFSLLGEAEPILRQVFDQKAKRMFLKRAR